MNKICILVMFLLCNAQVLAISTVESYLASLKDKKICLIVNPGNAGDALIWYGTISLFNKLELNYIVSSNAKDILAPDVDIVMYPGGGNLTAPYKACVSFIKLYNDRLKQLVILPHSINGYVPVLQGLKKNTIIFCREQKSLEFCKGNLNHLASIFFSDDMAFFSDMQAIQPLLTTDKKILPHLFAFRMDCEKNKNRGGMFIPKWNFDVSKIGYIGTRESIFHEIMESTTSEENMNVLIKFLSKINSYETVWTDRLHVGVAAFLLGKKVHLFDNSYGKIGNVYHASIKPRDIENRVTFHGDDFKILEKFKKIR